MQTGSNSRTVHVACFQRVESAVTEAFAQTFCFMWTKRSVVSPRRMGNGVWEIRNEKTKQGNSWLEIRNHDGWMGCKSVSLVVIIQASLQWNALTHVPIDFISFTSSDVLLEVNQSKPAKSIQTLFSQARWWIGKRLEWLSHTRARGRPHGYYYFPPGWDASPSQDTQHKATVSITTSPLDGMLDHHRIPSIKQLGVLLLPPWMGC